MTLRELSSALSASGVDSPKRDVLLLAEAASGFSSASLSARYDTELDTFPWYPLLSELVSRRAAREPLQYILGKWEFYGDEYTVTPDVLIPRPETELLVDYALSHLKKGSLIADVCCGSGCCGIAVCKRTDARCHGFDISEPALAVAKQNADALGVSDKINFYLADVREPGFLPSAEYDMIISNPPYVMTGELSSLAPELSYEPAAAFDGGEDGMLFYRVILDNCICSLSQNGVFVFEIGSSLSGSITELAMRHGFDAQIINDLSGLPRAAVLRRA